LSTPPVRWTLGAGWDYKISTLAQYLPVEFKLEKRSEGMSLTPRADLTWKLPCGIQGTAQVVVAITDARSNVICHDFTIAFE
jgi:hypothetical protein